MEIPAPNVEDSDVPRILLVDDDGAIRSLLRESFEDAGFLVSCAESGVAALAQIREFRPDVVVMDVVMPELDGFETCTRIHALAGFEELPVLMMTALDDFEHVNHAYDCGAVDIVSKPLNWVSLFHRVRRLVEGVRTTRQLRELEAWQRSLENSVPERMAMFRKLVEELPDPLFVLDDQGRIEYQNRAAARQLANGRQRSASGRALDFVHPEDATAFFEGVASSLESNGKGGRVDFRARTGTGAWRVWNADVVNLLHDSTVNGLVLVCRDITEAKEREAELADQRSKAEAMDRTKSEYLAVVSHELRSPLHNIIGHAELMLEDSSADLTRKQLLSLHRIRRSAREVLDLMFSVLDLTRLEKGMLPVDKEQVSVAEVLAEIRDDVTAGRTNGVHVVWRVDENLETLYTDRIKLKMVVRNLIGNAVQSARAGRIAVHARFRDGRLEVCVTDRGIHTSQKKIKRSFDICGPVGDRNGSDETVGMGLYIISHFGELLGGNLRTERLPGSGKRLTVSFDT